MTLFDIYSEFARGSNGFVKAVQTWGGMDLTDAEIERIAGKAETADDFIRIWETEDWYSDASQR